MRTCSSAMPAARAVGVVTFGRTCCRVRGDCQKTASRPRAVVNTNCEPFSRPRSRIRSIAAPRRMQERSGARSTLSGSVGPLVCVHGIAVERFCPRPRARRTKHHPSADRQAQQVAQPRIRVSELRAIGSSSISYFLLRRRQGASGSARVSSISWHQVSAALTARCACRMPRPTCAVAGPCPVPNPRLGSSASPLATVAPRMRLTPSLPSGPDPVDGSSPSESCASQASLGRSELSSNGWPRSVSTTLAVLFDQFLGAADRERGIVADRASDGLKALADGRRVCESRDGFDRQLRPDWRDLAGPLIDLVAVAA